MNDSEVPLWVAIVIIGLTFGRLFIGFPAWIRTQLSGKGH